MSPKEIAFFLAAILSFCCGTGFNLWSLTIGEDALGEVMASGISKEEKDKLWLTFDRGATLFRIHRKLFPHSNIHARMLKFFFFGMFFDFLAFVFAYFSHTPD